MEYRGYTIKQSKYGCYDIVGKTEKHYASIAAAQEAVDNLKGNWVVIENAGFLLATGFTIITGGTGVVAFAPSIVSWLWRNCKKESSQ